MEAGADHPFTVRFRGVRGSHAVCTPEQMRYGGMTTCVEVQAGGHRILLDAGGGLIGAGREMAQAYAAGRAPLHATLFLTHTHHDHLLGLPFFPPLYIQSAHVWIAGPKTVHGSIGDVLLRHLSSPFHPVPLEVMSATQTVVDLKGGECFRMRPGVPQPEAIKHPGEADPDDVVIEVVFNPAHPLLGVLHYAVTYHGHRFVFATDVEAGEDGDEILARFADGADLLAHDGAYTEQDYYEGPPATKGWGHSTWRNACKTGMRARVKRLAIIHYAPEYSDACVDEMAAAATALFPAAFLPRENDLVDLLADGA